MSRASAKKTDQKNDGDDGDTMDFMQPPSPGSSATVTPPPERDPKVEEAIKETGKTVTEQLGVAAETTKASNAKEIEAARGDLQKMLGNIGVDSSPRKKIDITAQVAQLAPFARKFFTNGRQLVEAIDQAIGTIASTMSRREESIKLAFADKVDDVALQTLRLAYGRMKTWKKRMQYHCYDPENANQGHNALLRECRLVVVGDIVSDNGSGTVAYLEPKSVNKPKD